MTTKLKTIPFFGQGINSKSPVVTRQRRLNCYYEFRKDGDKSKAVLYGTPGLVFNSLPAGQFTPNRGILSAGTFGYIVVSNILTGTPNSYTGGHPIQGVIQSSVGNVGMSLNQTQVIIVDGIGGYIYNVAAHTLVAISSNFPNGANTVAFLNGFFIVEQPGTPFFWVSNNGDGTTWNSLGFAAASQYTDTILAVDSLQGLLVTFSQTHMEFWQNVGSTPQPFQYISNSANEFGLAAIWSRAHVDNTICFLTYTREGGYQVACCNGGSTFVISTPDIDNIIQSMSVVSDATAMVYQVDSHKFYQLSFPTANRTLTYDITTDIWHEAQTGINPSGYTQRHIGNLSSSINGVTYITDYQNANIYTLSETSYTDNGAIIPREVTTRHALNDFNKFRVSQIFLDMETGIGLQSGQGSNPQVMMDVSKDGGRTFNTNSVERWASVGKVGQYKSRVRWRRVTEGRDVVCRFRMTDPVKFVITNGAAVISARQ